VVIIFVFIYINLTAKRSILGYGGTGAYIWREEKREKKEEEEEGNVYPPTPPIPHPLPTRSP
jgi:hypothetical protein